MNKLYKYSGLIAIVGIVLIVLGFILSKFSPSTSNSTAGLSLGGQQEHTFECTNVKHIDISELSESIRIERGNSDKLTIVYYTPENKNNVDVKEVNGTVSFSRIKNNVSLTVGFELGDTSTVVTLPKNFDGKIKASSTSGSVNIASVDCEDLLVKSSSGSVKLENITSKKSSEISTTSGSIKVSSLTTADDFLLKTSSGSIDIEAATCKKLEAESTSGSTKITDVSSETSSFEASSGNIKLENFSSKGKIVMKSTSGNIRFEKLVSDEIILESSSGSVSGSIKGSEKDYSILTKTSSGTCNLDNKRDGSKTLDAKTTSGSIRITFED